MLREKVWVVDAKDNIRTPQMPMEIHSAGRLWASSLQERVSGHEVPLRSILLALKCVQGSVIERERVRLTH